MKTLNLAMLVCLLVGTLLLLMTHGSEAFVPHDVRKCLSSHSCAVGVLGQISLDIDIGGCSRVQIGVAADVAVNPITGDVYIADSINNRILVYLSATIKLAVDLGVTSFCNIPADFVLGQLDFDSRGVQPNTRQAIIDPVAIHIDSHQNLWVVCKSCHRVLKFCLVDIFVGLHVGVGILIDAQIVLGQKDFVSIGVAIDLGLSVCLYSPVDIIIDEVDDRLWVVDQGHKRVVWYDHASQLVIGAKISGFIGVEAHASANILGLISLDISLDARVFVLPTAIVLDKWGNVYIADAVLNRVLRFKKSAYLAAAAQLDVNLLGLAQIDVCVFADVVIGQTDFKTTSGYPITDGGFQQPLGLCLIPALLDLVGTILEDVLLVLDNFHHRVPFFKALPDVLPPGVLSAGPATSILGQPTTSSSYLYGSPKGICSPAGFGLNLNAAVFVEFYNWLFICTGARVLIFLCL